MKRGSLRAVAFVSGLALLSTAVAACASSSRRKGMSREESLRSSFAEGLGFRGTLLVNDLGQAGPIRLRTEQASLADGLLFLVDVHNRLHVLDRGNLRSHWDYHGVDHPLRYPPTTNVLAILVMSGNELHQVDLRYGNDMGGAVHFDMTPSAPFVATAGSAFVPSWGGRGNKTLRTLNLVTGLEGWGYRTPGDIRAGMAIAGEAPRQVVYFATDSGDVYAMPAAESDAGAPEPTWVRNTRGAVTADLVVEGDDLFVASQSSFLYAMDRVTGRIRWAAPFPAALMSAPAATAGSVYQENDGALYCLDRETGKVRWKVAGATRFVVEREGRTVLQSSGGELWSVDGSGAVVGKADPGRFSYPTNTVDGTLYAVSREGLIVSLQVGGE